MREGSDNTKPVSGWRSFRRIGPSGSLVRSSFALLFPLLIAATAAADANFDPDTGFRIKHYRAVLPDSVPGGERIYTQDVEKLFRDGEAVFLDVMPSTGASYNPKTGKWRLVKRHSNIPGSVWLPDVGRGRIDAVMESYFSSNLSRLTGGEKSKPLVIYCQSDCWMAWNAVQRAAALGYSKIYWYPEGINGWADWDNPTVPAVPVPVEVENKRSATKNHPDGRK